jgi:hypothetical protein
MCCAVSDLTTFAVRFTFVCPVCKTLNDQQMMIKATSHEAAQDAAKGMMVRCKGCPAKVGANEGMIRLTEAGEQ